MNSKNSQATSFLVKEKEPKFKKQLELPSNLIRIETEDSSEEFIEIEFVKTHLGQEASGEIIPLLSPFELFSFKKAFGRGFGGKNAIKAFKKEDMEEYLITQYKLKTHIELKNTSYNKQSKNILWAKDKEHIQEIENDLLKNSKYLGKKEKEIRLQDNNLNNFSEEIKINVYLLEDEITKVNLRDNSKSGGATIDIMY